MNLEYDEKYEALRADVQAFLAEHAKDAPKGAISEAKDRTGHIEWQKLMNARGFAYRTIPSEYGGYGADPDPLVTVILDEEFNRAGVPRDQGASQGPAMLVPTLLEHGSEEQKQRWVEPTITGQVVWCQGYSEPDSGSDLASLQTSAKEDGDDFLINGQKIWTTTAAESEMMFVLVRTEPDASKHAGISYLLLPMDTPGIEVQPLQTMTGRADFNQIFFTDVRVPQANVVGQRGEGWKIANTTLKYERNSLGGAGASESLLLRLMKLLDRETVNGVSLIQSPVYRDRLMKLQARTLTMKYHSMRLLTCTMRGESPGVAGLVVKLLGCQLNHDIAALALDTMGELGQLYEKSKHERDKGMWPFQHMLSLGLIIGGGTAQIQKNIISERGLGMPREPKAVKV